MQRYLNDRDYCCLMRRKHNIQLRVVAEYVGCTVSMLSKYERGLANLASEKIKLYIKFLEQYRQV